MILRAHGQLWLGLGSDHTDRELEAVSVASSKQACPKPIASELWLLADASDHLDHLELRCEILEDGQWVLYQAGPLSTICPLTDLIDAAQLNEGGAMLCGTLGAIGGVRPSSSYKISLHDPVLRRTMRLGYGVRVLPVVC